jgi:thiamine pyrophosphate-dependent acetolactate synthase large subunit-like protein
MSSKWEAYVTATTALSNHAARLEELEQPLASENGDAWGSDIVAEMLRALDVPFVALNPGASFRGLHDSLVNHLGNREPQMLLCLHEEHAVAIAHGWAKVTERPMAAIVHSNVGLMHATMAVFNAWCDRVPLLLLGATGPVDAARRRPWIDWIHTARDQAALVRPYTKWDDQPASAEALVESLLRANLLSRTYPRGPTYICVDAGLQEMRLEHPPAIPDPKRYLPPVFPLPAAATIGQVADLLLQARYPVILAGRVGRDMAAWEKRIQLAESLDAVVLTDLKTPAAFPSTHRLHACAAGTFLTEQSSEVLRRADVILSLDWIDLAGTMKAAGGTASVGAKVVNVSGDQLVHNGWSMDHQGLAPTDLAVLAEPDPTVHLLLDAIGKRRGVSAWPQDALLSAPAPTPAAVDANAPLTVATLGRTLAQVVAGRDVCLIRGPLSWAGHLWDVEHPLDYLGIDGGAGLASGPGMAIGAALALRGSGRLPVSMIGDGDFCMGTTALWTGVHYRVPLLLIVANNISFYNDELHQERMAVQRNRPVANKWIGQRMSDPDIDIAMLARAQGAVGIGPVCNHAELVEALQAAVAAVEKGDLVVVDVRVAPGYTLATTLSATPARGQSR